MNNYSCTKKSNSLKIWVYSEMWGRVLDCLSRFRLVVACCKILSHNWILKYLSTIHSPAMKWFLDVWISLSALFYLWLLRGTSWYLMFMVGIVIFKVVDDSLFIKCKPGLIVRLLKSSVNVVKALIISLSLLFFIDLLMTALQSYTYIKCMYLFPLFEVVGKCSHRSE